MSIFVAPSCTKASTRSRSIKSELVFTLLVSTNNVFCVYMRVPRFFAEFDFELLRTSSFKEDSVREDLIAHQAIAVNPPHSIVPARTGIGGSGKLLPLPRLLLL